MCCATTRARRRWTSRRLSWPSARTALVYGRPVSGELAWLLMQARSRTPSQEERALLDPFMQLLATRKTIREMENYNE